MGNKKEQVEFRDPGPYFLFRCFILCYMCMFVHMLHVYVCTYVHRKVKVLFSGKKRKKLSTAGKKCKKKKSWA